MVELVGGRIMTRGSCLSSLGRRSVREASNQPTGPADGASGWGEEKQGISDGLVDDSQAPASSTPTHTHEVNPSCPCGAALRLC